MAVQRRGLGKGLDSMIPNKKKGKSQESLRAQPDDGIRKTEIEDVSRETSEHETNISRETNEWNSNVSRETLEVEKSGKKPEAEEIRLESEITARKISEDGQSVAGEEKTTLSEKDIHYVRISKVEPNRNQPRKVFNEDALQELADSITRYGVIQPLLVYDKKTYYEIIAGERRWRAAKIAGLKEIPVIIKDYSDREKVEISLIENLQREDLNPIEEAKAFRRLTEEFGLKQDELAESVSKSRTAITNSMRLLKLCDEVQQMVVDEMITSGHARALLAIENPEQQKAAALQIFDEKLSVRDAERLVKKLTTPAEVKPEKPNDTAQDAVYESIEEKLKLIIGTKVAIQRKRNNKGKIEIEYYSREELDRIIDLFDSIK